jgi:hypothetical protein
LIADISKFISPPDRCAAVVLLSPTVWSFIKEMLQIRAVKKDFYFFIFLQIRYLNCVFACISSGTDIILLPISQAAIELKYQRAFLRH